MAFPALSGKIDRRILVNYRVDPELIQPLLPEPFRPLLINDAAIAGICMIRLAGIRPARVPLGLGISSENAAHRIAVEWDESGQRRTGVYILRRDTSSRLSSLAGGRVFPGDYRHAVFDVADDGDALRIAFESEDGTAASLTGHGAACPPQNSVFGSLSDASAFFASGAVGYSPTRSGDRVEGIELRTDDWNMTALDVAEVRSSFYDDPRRFPLGTITFDSALLMRDIQHEWCSCAAPA